MNKHAAYLHSTVRLLVGVTVAFVTISPPSNAVTLAYDTPTGRHPACASRPDLPKGLDPSSSSLGSPPGGLEAESASGLSSAAGQAAVEMVPSTGPIPRDHYKTWSLFLVCNPTWLEPEKSGDLFRLYQQFHNFGRTIGDDHLAVWFWKKRTPANDPNLAENVDVERSVRFCRAFGLTPSAGPHVVVTDDYPEESNVPPDRAIFELGGLEPAEVSKLLLKLTDELVQKGKTDAIRSKVPEETRGSEARPPSLWISLLEVAQRTIVGFGCKVSVKIQTGFLSAELRECKTP